MMAEVRKAALTSSLFTNSIGLAAASNTSRN
jgi:hypothetical protein